LAAIAFGMTGALQHRAARRTPEAGTVRLSIIWDLLRQPLWLGSLVANTAGVVLQWVALSTAPLVLVQPILVLGLLFAVLITAMLHHHRPDRLVLLGTFLCVGGLAAFLVLAAPVPGHDVLSLDEVLPLAAGLFAIISCCLAAAVRFPGRVRVLGLATATGVLFGVTAGLAKLTAEELRHGVVVALTDWPIYAVAACGVTGFILSQNAFRAGVAMAPALAVMVALDPLVSIGIGALWLGERLQVGVGPVLGQVLALVAAVVGIAVLSRRAPQVAEAAAAAENRS
jgi:drug/metabolite transporter (DMT)-like permease